MGAGCHVRRCHDAATDSFQSSDGDLSNLNPNAPLNGTLPASGSDTFVDVYAYSTPVFLGSFPVIAGNVVLSNLNLSNLPAGAHRLVIQGQSSGALAVLRLNIAASGLANGGSQGVLLPLGGAALMLLAGAAPVLRERKTLARLGR